MADMKVRRLVDVLAQLKVVRLACLLAERMGANLGAQLVVLMVNKWEQPKAGSLAAGREFGLATYSGC